jgi:hypothetical protein
MKVVPKSETEPLRGWELGAGWDWAKDAPSQAKTSTTKAAKN